MGIRCDLGTSGNMRGNMYRGVGGGGSVVEITPTLNSGTKIADYSIDGVPDELYAPTVDDLSDMTWTLVDSTTSESNYSDIDASWKYFVIMGSISGVQRMFVSVDKISDIQKSMNVSGVTSVVIGHEWYDFSANHTYCIAEITDQNKVRIKSGYGTVTCYLYAVS